MKSNPADLVEHTAALERGIVSCLLRRPSDVLKYEVDPECFRSLQFRRVYQAIVRLVIAEGELPDPPQVLAAARDIGAVELQMSDLYTWLEDETVNLPGMIRDLRREWRHKCLRLQALQFIAQLSDSNVDTQDIVATCVDGYYQAIQGQDAAHLQQRDQARCERIRQIERGEAGQDRVPTGFFDFDQAFGGVPRGGLTVIGGRPGRGKSALLQQVCDRVVARGGRALLATPEMMQHEVIDRDLARSHRISLSNLHSVARGVLRPTVDRGIFWLYDEPRQTTRHIVQVARRLCTIEEPLDLIAVDYIQYVADRREPGEARYELIGRMARRLKQLGRQLNCAVIVGAQLKREAEGKEPTLGDLRESGDLEQDADMVWLLSDAVEVGLGEEQSRLNVAKNRQGPQGAIQLRWVKEHTAFHDVVPG